MKRFFPIAALIGLAIAVYLKRPVENVHALTGTAMGCQWNLQWRGPAPPPEVLAREVATTLETWEQVLSHWRQDSDLSRHNRGETATAELNRVIELADSIKSASAGAFDHRMLEKSHAAGFGPPGRGIDLSAIGKGFAADRVGETLRTLGVPDFLFEIGGEVLAGDGEWEIAIEQPDPASSTIARTVRIRDQALATSGNYRQFHPAPRGLASHLLDPATGTPLIRPPSSVTVIARDCATADAWATALFIQGPDHPTPPEIKVHWQQSTAK